MSKIVKGYLAAYVSRVMHGAQPVHIVPVETWPQLRSYVASSRTLCGVRAASYTEGETDKATYAACKRELARRQAIEIIPANNGSALGTTSTDAGANIVFWRTAEALVRSGFAEIYTGPDGGRWVRTIPGLCPGSGAHWGSGSGSPVCSVCYVGVKALAAHGVTVDRPRLVRGHWRGIVPGHVRRPGS